MTCSSRDRPEDQQGQHPGCSTARRRWSHQHCALNAVARRSTRLEAPPHLGCLRYGLRGGAATLHPIKRVEEQDQQLEACGPLQSESWPCQSPAASDQSYASIVFRRTCCALGRKRTGAASTRSCLVSIHSHNSPTRPNFFCEQESYYINAINCVANKVFRVG